MIRPGVLATLFVLLLPAITIQAAPRLVPEVVRSIPRDSDCFTQGLGFVYGELVMSCGLVGKSRLLVLDAATGDTRRTIPLPRDLFAEGFTQVGSQLVLLTWQNHIALKLDARDYQVQKTLPYNREGWGVALLGQRLAVSNGSDKITFLNPKTLTPIGEIHATDEGRPVNRLNELESWRGKLLANVWERSELALIDPTTGRVEVWMDLAPLFPPTSDPDAVVNGVAYDPVRDELYVTGKRRNRIYIIKPPKPAIQERIP